MEIFVTILGLIMIYSWVHGVVIIGRKIKDTTTYENVVLIIGLVALVLFVLGSL
jgi:hypothetical protein